MGWQVVGVDITAAAVQAARARAAAAGVGHRCAFVQHDVLALPGGFSWEQAKELEQQQQRMEQDEECEPRLEVNSGSVHQHPQQQQQQGRDNYQSCFDFIYDCQTFHVLLDQDQQEAVASLGKLLRPGGQLMLLTGNANEPYCGPNVLTEGEIRGSFPPSDWEVIWFTQSWFDETVHYREVLKKRPLAWWVLLRRL